MCLFWSNTRNKNSWVYNGTDVVIRLGNLVANKFFLSSKQDIFKFATSVFFLLRVKQWEVSDQIVPV
jgi:hypothetical protein